MVKRGITILAVSALTFAVFMAMVGAAMLSREWMHQRLRDVIAHEAALALNREVAVGPIEGNLRRAVTIHGFAIAGDGPLSAGAFAAAPRIGASYALGRMILGGVAGAAIHIDVDDLVATLVRGADGNLDLPGPKSSDADRPAASVGLDLGIRLNNAQLRYTDRSLRSPDGDCLAVILRDLSASTRLRPLLAALAGERKTAPVDLSGSILVACEEQSATARISGDWTSARIDDLHIDDLRTGDAMSASRIDLEYRPDAILAHKRPAIQALTSARIGGPRVRISRDADGELPILRLARAWFPPSEEPARAIATLTVDDGAATLTDHTLIRDGRPLIASLEELNGRLDLASVFDAIDGGRAAPAGDLRARIAIRNADLLAAARLRTNVTTHLTLTDLSSTLDGRLLADAQRVSTDYDLGALAGAEGIAGIRAIEADALHADLTLDENNSPTFLPRDLGPPSPNPEQPPGEFGAQVTLRDSDVAATLRSVTGPGGPLRVRLREADLSVDADALLGGRRRDAGRIAGVLAASLGDLSAGIELRGVIGRGLHFERLALTQAGAQILWVTSGSIDLDCRKLASAPQASVRRVDARGLRARIVRDARGEFAALASLPATDVRAERPGSPGFIARVRIDDGDVTYADRSRTRGLNAGHVGGLNADIDLGRLWAASEGRSTRRIGSVRGSVNARGPGVAISVAVRADLDGRLDLTRLSISGADGEAIARAERGSLEFTPHILYAGRVAEGLRRVGLTDARADLVREADGGLRISRLIGGRPPRGSLRETAASRSAEAPQWTAAIALRNVRARFTDYSAPEGPVVLWTDDLSGVGGLGPAASGRIRGSIDLRSPSLWGATDFATNIGSHASLSGLLIQERTPAGPETLVEAGRASADYDLARLLGGDAVGAFARVALSEFDVNLAREADGRMRLARLMGGVAKPAKESRARTGQDPRAVVNLADGTVRYADHALGDGPVILVAKRVRGRVRSDAVMAALDGEETETPGWLRADLSLRAPRLEAGAAFEADLDRRVSLTGLAVRDLTEDRTAEIATLSRAVIEYSPRGLFGARPLEAIEHIGLELPEITVIRAADGELNLVRLARSVLGEEAPSEGGEAELGELTASVSVTGGRAYYRDHSVDPSGAPRAVALADVTAAIPPGQIAALMRGEAPADRSSITGELRARWEDAEAQGRFDADLAGALCIERGLLAATQSRGPRASARRLTVALDMADLLDDATPVSAAVTRIAAEGFDGDITRDAGGRIDLLALFEGPEPPGTVAPQANQSVESLAARVEIRDSSVRYTDLALTPDGPVRITLTSASGSADLGRVLPAVFREPGADAAALEDLAELGDFSGAVEVRMPAGALSAEVQSADLSRNLELANLHASGGEAGSLVTCERAVFAFDLAELLDSQSPWPAGIARCHLERPVIQTTRHADGTLDLAEIIPSSGSEKDADPLSPESFSAVVSVRDGQAHLLDEAVRAGPARIELAKVDGEVDAGKFWSARRGGIRPGIGRLRADARTWMPAETTAVSAEWDLDGELILSDASIIQSGKALPILALDTATLAYDPGPAFAPDGDIVASLTDVTLGRAWLQARRRVDGGFEASKTFEAYLPEQAPGAADEEASRAPGVFAAGLRARVRARDLAVCYEDLAAESALQRLVVSGAAGDVRFDRLAALVRGEETGAPGWVRGSVAGAAGELRLVSHAEVDLGGEVAVSEALLSGDGGDRRIIKASQLAATLDAARLLSGEAVLGAIRRLSATGAEADIRIDEHGQWEALAALGLTPADEEGGEDATALTAELALDDCAVTYSDPRLADRAPVLAHIEARDVTGRIDLGAVWDSRGGEPRNPGELRASVRIASADTTVEGRLETDLARRAQLRDLSVITQSDGTRRVLVAARLAALRANLGEVLAGGPPAQQLDALDLWDLRAQIRRNADGVLELAELLGGAGEGAREAGDPMALGGRVHLHNGDVTYEDKSLGVEGDVVVALVGANGVADLSAIQRMIDGGEIEDAGGIDAHLTGRFGAYGVSGDVRARLSSDVEVSNLNVREGSSGDVVVTARRLAAEYDAASILEGGIAQHVTSVSADGLRASIVVDRDGTPALAQGLKIPAGDAGAEGFGGHVRVTDSEIALTDYSQGDGEPLWIAARGLGASVDVGAMALMQADGRTRDAGRVACDVSARAGPVTAGARIDGRVSEGLTLADLRVEGEGTADRLAASRVVLEYGLGPMLAGAPWTTHIHYAGAHDLAGLLTRERDGRLRLLRLAEEALGMPEAPPSQSGWGLSDFCARVALANANVRYVDEALLERGPLVADLSDANADVDFSALQRAVADEDAPCLGAIHARVDVRTRTERLTATLGGKLDEELVLADLLVRRIDRDEQVLRADRVAFRGRFEELARSPGGLPGLVRQLELVGIRGTIKRDAEGRITSPEALSFRRRGEARSDGPRLLAGAFETHVMVRDVALRLEDEALLGAEDPVRIELVDVGGDVVARGELGGDGAWVEPRGSLRGRLIASTPGVHATAAVETDLVSNLWVRDLCGFSPTGERLAAASEVQLGYDLAEMIGGSAWHDWVQAARLRDVHVSIGADARGRLTIAGAPVRGMDLRAESPVGPMALGDINGALATDAQGVLQGELRVRGSGEVLGGADVALTYDPRDGWLDLEGTVERVNLAAVGGLVLPPEHGRISQGWVSAGGIAYGELGGEEAEVAWTVRGEVGEGQARISRIGGETVAFEGPFEATSEGVRTECLAFAAPGIRGEVSGAVLDLGDPLPALEVSARASGEDLVRLLPQEARERVSALRLSDEVELAARITGPAKNADARITARSSGQVMASVVDLGTVFADGVDIGASVVGWQDPSVLASATLRNVAIDRALDPAARPEEPEDEPRVPGGPMRIDLVSADGSLGRARVSIPQTRVWGIAVEDVAASVALRDQTLDVTSLRGNVLGGRLAGAGVIQLAEGGVARVGGALELTGAQLGRLQDAQFPWAKSVQGGELSAFASGSIGGEDSEYGVDAQVSRPVIDGEAFESARAWVVGRGDVARIELADICDGDGHVWARGEIEKRAGADGARALHADLHAAAAEFDLDRLPLTIASKDVGGVAYVSARVTGDLADPDFSGWAQVFGPRLGGQCGDAITMQVHRVGSHLQLGHLGLCAGHAVASVSGARVEGFALRRGGEEGRGVRVEGDIHGAILRAFAPAEDLAQIANSDLDTGGRVRLSGAVGGTLRHPTLTSSVTAEKVRVGEFFIDEARLPVMLAGDRALLSGGYVRGHGAELAITGRAGDIYGRRDYVLTATAPQVALEDLPPVHRLGLDVSGIASLPQVTIWGSRESKPGGSAVFNIAGLRLGPEELLPVSGWARFGDGLLHIDATKIRRRERGRGRPAGGGREGYVSVSATYDLDRRLVDAGIRVAGAVEIAPGEEPSEEDIAALPDIGSMIQLASPLVAIVEAVTAAPGSAADAGPKAESAARKLARLGLRSSGQVAGEFRIIGPMDDPSVRTQFTVWNADLDGKPLPERVDVGLCADLRGRELRDVRAEAVDGNQYAEVVGNVTLGGEDDADRRAPDGNIDLRVALYDIDLAMWRHWLPRPLPIGGSANVDLVVTGATDSPQVEGTVDINDPSYAGARFDLLSANIAVAEGAASIRKATLIRSEEGLVEGEEETEGLSHEIAMEGVVPWTWGSPWIPPDGEVDLRAELKDIDLSFFPPILDDIARESAGRGRREQPTLWSDLQAAGAVYAKVTVAGRWALPELEGEAMLTGGSVRVGGWRRPIEDVELDVRFLREAGRNRGVVHEARGRWGSLELDVEDAWAYLDHFGRDELGDNEYHLDVAVHSDKYMDIGGLMVGRISGGVGFHTRLPEGDASPAGEIARPHELLFENLTARMGAGKIALSGWAKLANFSPDAFADNEYDIALICDSADVRYGRQLKGVLQGAQGIRLHRLDCPEGEGSEREERVRLEGALTLEQAEIALAAPSGEGRAYLGLPQGCPSPEFDVRLMVGDGVRLRGMGITAPLKRGEMAKLSGTLQAPRVVGGVVAREGAVRVPTGAVQINEAWINYEFGPEKGALARDRTPLALSGDVHIEAQRTISGADVPGWGGGSVDIFILVSGQLPNNITVRTRSVPPLGEQQILALMGSQPLGGLAVSGQKVQDVLEQQALNMLVAGFKATVFEPIESELMKLLGLTEFNINFGFDQEIEVRLGKYLIKDLLVSYEHAVGAGQDDRYKLSVSYRLKDRVHVAYTTNEQGEGRVELTYDVDL